MIRDLLGNLGSAIRAFTDDIDGGLLLLTADALGVAALAFYALRVR